MKEHTVPQSCNPSPSFSSSLSSTSSTSSLSSPPLPSSQPSPASSSRKSYSPEADRVKDGLFFTPTFQALTIGIPFCVFKLLFGLLALRTGAASVPLFAFGWLVIAWALADLFMNLARIFFHLADRTSPIEYCTLAQAGRLFKRPRLFLAFDTLISFSIICFVLWSGWIVLLGRGESYIWYAATTMNLISISIVNIWMELRKGS
ncbi:MAG: hypothetical protein JW999_11290 [Methanotrichaceae archaeon]|nr:hypothetical protein [Methanotrichaceae archaeon]